MSIANAQDINTTAEKGSVEMKKPRISAAFSDLLTSDF
jgi:hypothetical protein